jgi:glycosyltransferase involved in cell wall biosynthesis
MTEHRRRVLFVCSHPTQYSAPAFRAMAGQPGLEILVAYCGLGGAAPLMDPGFGIPVQWDIPLLDGYPWVHVPNKSWRPNDERVFGLINPGLWRLVRTGAFDALVAYTGYKNASFWIAVAAAKASGTPLLFGTDAHELRPRDQRIVKTYLKRVLWPWLFCLADVVIVPSSRSVILLRSLGIASERVVLTPIIVDNDWWSKRAEMVDGMAPRRRWGISELAKVVLFCGKLQPWKRPQDVLGAFARARVPGSYLVYAGEGPLRPELEREAEAFGLRQHVRFVGFVNQSSLPEVYKAADLLVVPSEYEPFGVVVNEAMLCGCPVVVSDRVGAGYELVSSGQNGFVFPCGDVTALAGILREVLPRPDRLWELGGAARKRVKTWSVTESTEALVEAVARAVELRRGRRSAVSAAG